MNSESNTGPPVALMWRQSSLHPMSRAWEAPALNRPYLWASARAGRALGMVGSDGAGLNCCSGFKVSLGSINRVGRVSCLFRWGLGNNEIKPHLLPGYF